MKNIAILSLSLIALILIQGCGKPEAPLGERCVLKSITSEELGRTTLYVYEPKSYQLKKTLTYLLDGSAELLRYSLFTYNENGLVNKIEDWSANFGLDSYDAMFYDSENRMIKIETYDQDSLGVIRLAYSSLFAYSPGLVTETRQFPDGTTDWTFTYTLGPTDQPARIQGFLNGQLIYTVDYTHDTSPNPYWEFFLSSSFPWQRRNNLGSRILAYEDGSYASSSTYSYQYNSDGYPVSELLTSTTNSGTYTYNWTYEYECGVGFTNR